MIEKISPINSDNKKIPSLSRITKSNYHPQATDTAIEVDIYLFARLRQLSLKQRIGIRSISRGRLTEQKRFCAI